MNYQEFKEEFKESGLSQKGFSESKEMSPSIVSYYLSRARDQKVSKNTRGIIISYLLDLIRLLKE